MQQIDNDIDWNQLCWKYMNPDYFIDQLKNQYMYFASALEFEDNYEGATYICDTTTAPIHSIPTLNSIDNAFKELKRMTKICCWHKSEYENNLMWKLYANNKKGVAIITTPKRMQESFKAYRIQPQYSDETLYIGNVKYVDLNAKHINDTMLNVFFNKHIAFQAEKELRLAISLRGAEEFGVQIPSKGIKVPVDYEKLIVGIVLGPDLSVDEKDALVTTITKLGYESKLRKSSLDYKPIFF